MKSFKNMISGLKEKRDYIFHKELDELTNVSGDLAKASKTAGPGTFKTVSGPDGPTLQRKRRKELDLYNGKVFTVSETQFEKLKSSGVKSRGKHWKSYVDENSDLGREIKTYSLRNPSKPVVIKNGVTGETMFIRRRWNDNRLRHNKKQMENKKDRGWQPPKFGWGHY